MFISGAAGATAHTSLLICREPAGWGRRGVRKAFAGFAGVLHLQRMDASGVT